MTANDIRQQLVEAEDEQSAASVAFEKASNRLRTAEATVARLNRQLDRLEDCNSQCGDF